MQTLSASGGERSAAAEALQAAAGPQPHRAAPSSLPFSLRQEKQLAAPAREVPSGSLFLPRHRGGHPGGVPEDGPDHVLPVDV